LSPIGVIITNSFHTDTSLCSVLCPVMESSFGNYWLERFLTVALTAWQLPMELLSTN